MSTYFVFELHDCCSYSYLFPLNICSHTKTFRPQFTPWLATLLVLPAHRGKGVGSALANGAAAEVKAAPGDTEAIYLWAIERDVADRMYKKLGWTTIEETKPTHGNADIAIIMKRSLQP